MGDQKEKRILKKEEGKPDYSVLKKYEERERDNLRNSIPGAVYRIELDNSHPLLSVTRLSTIP
jgi:hypothetical protein